MKYWKVTINLAKRGEICDIILHTLAQKINHNRLPLFYNVVVKITVIISFIYLETLLVTNGNSSSSSYDIGIDQHHVISIIDRQISLSRSL